MQRIVTCSIIIVLLITTAVFGYCSIKNTSDSILESLEATIQSFRNDDLESAVEHADAAEREWNEFFEVHVFITDKEHMLEITSSLTKIKAMAQENNDELIIEAQSAKKLIEIYLDKQNPELMNIL